jgi:hypothetical protein
LFTDDAKLAMTRLLARVLRAQDERDAADKLKKDAEARYNEAYRAWIERRNAFSSFGFDPSVAGFWDRVKAGMGSEAWAEAFRRAGHTLKPKEPAKQEAAAEPKTTETPAAALSESESPTVRDFVLGELIAAGAQGRKASELRAEFDRLFSRQLHEKTMGMTLYRLSEKGRARREGRTWFFVPQQDANTKNPGAGTPGSESPSEGKEEA